MGFRPALTKTELHEVALRKDPEDVVRLLWEIKRLRAIVLRIDQLQRCLTAGGGPGVLLDGLRSELAVEPCVAEQARLGPDYR
jgi:hypothetical protein